MTNLRRQAISASTARITAPSSGHGKRGPFPGSPLQHWVSTAVRAGSPDDAQLLEIAAKLPVCLPALTDPLMRQFLHDMFSDRMVLSAYFQEHELEVGGQIQRVLPFNLAWQAGRQAHGSQPLLPHEKSLAWVGAFAYGSGLFLAMDPNMRPTLQDQTSVSSQFVQHLRSMALAAPLRRLKGKHAGMADLIAAAVSVSHADDGENDADQAGRLAAAVRLANLKVEALWL